jgi:hypothetical protein
MLSQSQFSNQSMSLSKQAMPEKVKYDGPGSVATGKGENTFAAHSNMPLPKPGFSG